MRRKTFTNRNLLLMEIIRGMNEEMHPLSLNKGLTKVAQVKLFLRICLPHYFYDCRFMDSKK